MLSVHPIFGGLRTSPFKDVPTFKIRLMFGKVDGQESGVAKCDPAYGQ